MKFLLIIFCALSPFFFAIAIGQSKNKENIYIKVQLLDENKRTTIKSVALKLNNKNIALSNSSKNTFSNNISGSFDFQKPMITNIKFIGNNGHEDIEMNRVVYLDADTINIVINTLFTRITVKGGSTNKIENEFVRIDNEYFDKIKNIEYLNPSDIEKERYKNYIPLMKKHNNSYAVYNRIYALFSPKAFSVKEDIQKIIYNLDPIFFPKLELERLQNDFSSFVRRYYESEDDRQFPDLETVHNVNDIEFDLIRKKYKYILIDIWAMWCGPCKQQHPKLSQLSQKYKENNEIAIIGICYQSVKNEWDDYINKSKLLYNNYWLDEQNSNKLSKQIGILSVPRYILLRSEDAVLVENNIHHDNLELVIEKYCYPR